MVVASPSSLRTKKTKAVGIPTIDLSTSCRSTLSESIVKACEEYGFFKVVNHGVPKQVLARLEDQAVGFFAKPATDKQRAGPPTPFGYGCKNIGRNGDTGELEYLLLHTSPHSISEKSKSISNDPAKFRYIFIDSLYYINNLATYTFT